MKALPFLLLAALLAGCGTTQKVAKLFEPDPNAVPPHLDPTRRDWWDRSIHPHDGLHAYHVQVEVSDAGSHIELNGEHLGAMTNTIGEIIIWGDNIGRWRGQQLNVLVANPVRPGQRQQRKVFLAEENIPRRVYFDLNLISPTNAPSTQNININSGR